MEEDDWKRLPFKDKISHKLWRARLEGYEELTKQIPLLESHELEIYCDIVRQAPLESNAAALDKALEFVLSFLQNAPTLSDRIVSECVCAIANKVMSARPKSKQLGFDVCLQLIENEVSANVTEELLKVVNNKNPKIVNGSSELILLAIKEFGGKVIDIKSIVKLIPKYLSHNDKNVRNNAKAISIECYYYLGNAIKSIIADIQPVQMKELEEEFGKLKGQPLPVPNRRIRSQQKASVATGTDVSEMAMGDGEAIVDDDEALDIIDPYDLMEPVDIIPMIPADFDTKINEAKWQLRKEALESIAKLVQSPRITPGNFTNLIGALKKVVASDVNVNVCLMAINTTRFLAKGLRSEFNQYCATIIPALLDRFKEKKPNIVSALRDTIDACSCAWSLDNIIAIVTPYYDHKIPTIREESIKYVGRYLANDPPTIATTSTTASLSIRAIKANNVAISKASLKSMTTDLVKKMDDSVGPVREATAEIFAILMQICGENVLNALVEGHIDDIKKNKIKSIYLKMIGASTNPNTPINPNPNLNPSATNPNQKPTTLNSSSQTFAQSNPQSMTPQTKSTNTNFNNNNNTSKNNPYENDEDDPTEADIEEDTAIEKAMGTLLTEELVASLTSSLWKARLESVETIKNKVALDPKMYDPCVVFKVLSKKPGWRDGNLQVYKVKLSVMSHLIEVRPFSRRAAHNLILIIADKIGDIKMKEAIRALLVELAEAISLNYVSIRLARVLHSAKSVKVQSEILSWINDMLIDFGLQIDIKPHIAMVKFSLEQVNPEVKKAAIHLAARMYVYMGGALKTLLVDIKPAQMQQIEGAFNDLKNHPISKPIRGVEQIDLNSNNNLNNSNTVDQQTMHIEHTANSNNQNTTSLINLEDLIERIDVSDKITDEIISNLEDKNWKVRTESLEQIRNLFKSRTPVKNTGLYPLITAIVMRLQDNNKNIIVLTLNICSELIESIGPSVYEHKNTLLRAILTCLMDSKPNVQNAAMSTLNVWNLTVPIRMTLNNDCLVVSELLSIENPNLRFGILTYLMKSLENVSELPANCIEFLLQPFFKCLVDRKHEVRKMAQELTPILINFYGFNGVKKRANDLEATVKNVVMPIIEQNANNLKNQSHNEISNRNINKLETPTKNHVEKIHFEEVEMEEVNKIEIEMKEIEIEMKEIEMKEDIVETPPRLKFVSGSKKLREIEDSNHKIIQWNFGTLKPTYISHLNELMNPFFNADLINLLFHSDFKNHIMAAQLLTDICVNGSEVEKLAYFEVFDLILKWCVIKFFETNPSVHVKGLELIDISLQEFQKGDRLLCDYEVNSFLNYLCIKFGDPKEGVRKLAHQVFNSLIPLYDSAKLLNLLTFGLRHKLVRVKADSLLEMTSMLENDNIDKFVDVLNIVIPEVAKFVVDRDVNIKRNASQFFSQIYLSLGPAALNYINKCDKSIKEVIIEKFNKIHPQYLALKQSQLSLLEEQDSSNNSPSNAHLDNTNFNNNNFDNSNRNNRHFNNSRHDDSIVTDEYLISISRNEHQSGVDSPIKYDKSTTNLTTDTSDSMNLVNLTIEEPHTLIPRKFTLNKEPYLKTTRDIRSVSIPLLIPIDETLLSSPVLAASLMSNLEKECNNSIESDYVENFLKVESIFQMLKRDNTLNVSIQEQLLAYFNFMNNDIILLNLGTIETHIENYYTRNLWMWADALDLFSVIIINAVDKENFTDSHHHMHHNYIETCLYQINILTYDPKFRTTFTVELQSKFFTLFMDLNANETFNAIFKSDKVFEIMSSVVAQLISCTPIVQSLSVILALIQNQLGNVNKTEFLLRLFWKCSQAIAAEFPLFESSELDSFISTYYLIRCILYKISQEIPLQINDYFNLLEHCFMNVVKRMSKDFLFSLPSILNDSQFKSHIENTITKLNIQFINNFEDDFNVNAKRLMISNLESNVNNFVDYKNSIEKLVRCRLHSKINNAKFNLDDNVFVNDANDFNLITDVIKWKASLDNVSKCLARQHIINGKVLQDTYGVDVSSSNSSNNSTCMNTPTQPVRKYISQLLDSSTNSGLDRSNMNFASPTSNPKLARTSVTSTSKLTVTGPNLASLKARLDKIKARNTS